MASATINNIEHRVVDQEVCDWLDTRIDNALKDNPWYNVAHKALFYMRNHPVKYEVNPDGTYTVVVPSESEPGREYVATPTECDCPGNGRHGRCYHRMIARLLEAVDRYENRRAAHLAEMARRTVTQVVGKDGTSRWAASYDGHLIGVEATDVDARAAIEAWVAARDWLKAAQQAA